MLSVLLIGDERTGEALLGELAQDFERVDVRRVARAEDLDDGLSAPHVDVVLIDGDAPWADPLDLTSSSKARWRDCAVVVVVGRGRALVDVTGGDAPLDDYVRLESREAARRLSRAARVAVRRAEQRRALEAAREALDVSEARLRAIVDAAPSGILAWDERGAIEMANAEAGRLFGVDPVEAIGRAVDELVAPLRPGRDVVGVRRDGASFPIDLAIREAHLAGRRTFIGIVRDIADERRAEEALRRSEASFRALIEASPEPIVVHRDGAIVYANPALVAYLGFSARPGAVHGRPVCSLVHPDDREAIASWLAGHGHAERVEARLSPCEDATGSLARCEIHAELASMPLVFDGEPARAVLFHDITDRKRFAAELLRAERMASMGVLSAGIAHEINNPLAYLTLNLQYVEQQLAALERAGGGAKAGATVRDAHEAVRQAREGAQRVTDIVRALRLLSRPEAGYVRPTDVEPVVESAIQIAGHEIRHRARLVRDFTPVPAVAADPGGLGQALLHLLVNAAHAIDPPDTTNGEIRVRIRPLDGDRVEIEIRDTGVGIAPESLERIFDPFFTTKPPGAASGLGLSISHSTIASFGGTLAVESEVGRGSTFRVSLRVAHGLDAPEQAAATPLVSMPRVLVIDDEPLVGASIARMLSRGHRVESVTRGADAIERIRKGERFDAILCDVMMPEMTGTDVHDALVALAPEQAGRMVFLSGGAFTDRAERLLEGSGRPRLHKPCGAAQLEAAIAAVSRAT